MDAKKESLFTVCEIKDEQKPKQTTFFLSMQDKSLRLVNLTVCIGINVSGFDLQSQRIPNRHIVIYHC